MLLGIVPRVQERHAGGLEVGAVAGHNCHAMHQRCRCNQRIPLSARVGHKQARAALSDGSINRKNPSVELWQNERLEPCAEHRALLRDFAFELQYTDFQFKD